MASGYSALVGSFILKPQVEDGQKVPANIPFVILGTSLLWFGWTGFNSGSALGMNEIAVQAFLATNASASTSMITWVLLDQIQGRRISAISACNGAVVGLVTITPASGFVTVGAAMCMGIMGAIAAHLVSQHFKRWDVDDSLDVFPCHGVGGTIGMLLTGCFANHQVNPEAEDGLFYGGKALIGKQIAAICGLVAYIIVMSYIIFKLVDYVFGLRVTDTSRFFELDSTLIKAMTQRKPRGQRNKPAAFIPVSPAPPPRAMSPSSTATFQTEMEPQAV
eukprot:c6828_g1_i1.p1 GENE.c6828_g1_i1~~c6828_g1_i1.p1  ORF type:complete len:277 (+),score=49.95 c6828_g1_i1:760-1590(+)